MKLWDPRMLPWLDDGRVEEAHDDCHRIMGSLERLDTTDPEVARWATRPEQVRQYHDFCVSVLAARKLPHASDMDGDREHVMVSDDELRRDLADLYRQWTWEGRWDTTDRFHAGRLIAPGHFERSDTFLNPDRHGMREMAAKVLTQTC